MESSKPRTPGVYINETDGFSNSVVPVETAVPAFIGYTPKAEYEGKSYYNKPQKITSFADFQAFFMIDDPAPPAEPSVQYKPEYYLEVQKEQPTSGAYMMINNEYYSILPDPNTIYHLYNSVRLFYQNGGGDAYIVAVGTYGAPSGKPLEDPSKQIVNANVSLSELKAGLKLLLHEEEPTIYICPEATLLSLEDNSTLMQEMLLQAEQMQTTICLFDIIGGQDPDPIMYTNDIEAFRNGVGSKGLKYGASYYPFVGTTIMQPDDISFKNLFGGDIKRLGALLSPPENPNSDVETIIAAIEKPPANPLSTSQYNSALLNASKTYSLITKHLFAISNMLPPSGGMAGIYTVNDSQQGVWHAPANVSMVGVTSLPIRLSSSEQENLNVDAVSGKSVNAIRFFNGQGILVWGARTLDGNSEDWRYISVRRTMTFLEQSVKLAARAYVFAENTPNTWAAVKSMISSFLVDIWKQGGLQGATAADAFTVDIGLGSTMTAEDILNGFMNVTVKVAVVRPAEFIIITFQQEMAKSG